MQLVARRFGLPIKGITLFLSGGVAEMDEEPASAKAEFWISLTAGVTAANNLSIVGRFSPRQ